MIRIIAFIVLISAFLCSFAFAAEPVPVIFDTDMDSDCDDAAALAMIHAFADRGEISILATPISARYLWSGACVDAINTYFGRPDIPIGIPKATPNKQGSRYAKIIAEEFPHDYPHSATQPDALDIYRTVLATAADHSVVLITVGDVTNVRDLLVSPSDQHSPLTGMELAKLKIKHWYCMGSRYPSEMDPNPWGNFKMDPQATTTAIRDWPGDITFTGGQEFAWSLATGARLSELPQHNPVRRTYEIFFNGQVKNQHSADQIAVMIAVRGTGHPWKLVTKGHNHIFENGNHEWRETPDNPHQQYISALADGVKSSEVAQEMDVLMLHLPAGQK